MYWSKYKTHLVHGIKANTCLQMCSIFIYLCVRSGAGVDCVTAHPWGLSAESRPLTTSQGWGKKGSCLGRTLSFPCSVKQARTILEVRGGGRAVLFSPTTCPLPFSYAWGLGSEPKPVVLLVAAPLRDLALHSASLSLTFFLRKMGQ